jgi:hypothetical protein
MEIKGIKFSLSIILVVLMACSPKVVDQTIIDKVGYDIPGNYRIVEIDNLGRLYVVNAKNTIVNHKTDLTKAFEFSNRRGGTVSSVDVTNPLQIVAFSDDFNQSYVLDNTLSLIKTVSFGESFSDVTACGTSNDGNFWVFDPTRFVLAKVDDKGKTLIVSSNVNDFGLEGCVITDIREKGNYVVMMDRYKGFYVFDNLGQYVTRYEVNDTIKSFQFDGNNIYYTTPSGLKMYDIKAKKRQIIGSPYVHDSSKLRSIVYGAGNFYMLFEQGINIVKSQ